MHNLIWKKLRCGQLNFASSWLRFPDFKGTAPKRTIEPVLEKAN